MSGSAELTLGYAFDWVADVLLGHSERGWSLFHRGGGSSRGVWGGAVDVYVGVSTLGAAVGSSVGAPGGGATLGPWGASSLGAVAGSSLVTCRRYSCYHPQKCGGIYGKYFGKLLERLGLFSGQLMHGY